MKMSRPGRQHCIALRLKKVQTREGTEIMFRWLVRLASVALVLAMWGGVLAFAQNGRVSGQVSDQQGGLIPKPRCRS